MTNDSGLATSTCLSSIPMQELQMLSESDSELTHFKVTISATKDTIQPSQLVSTLKTSKCHGVSCTE